MLKPCEGLPVYGDKMRLTLTPNRDRPPKLAAFREGLEGLRSAHDNKKRVAHAAPELR